MRIKRERKRFCVINCGRRFGKDIISIDLLIEAALEGYPVAWFQPTYKSLLEVWRAMKRILAPVTVKNGASEQDKRIELITGGVIDFWSLDGDPEACRGRKYRRVVINEAAKAKHLQVAWELAIRPALADFKGDAYFPSTPRGRDFYHELWMRGQPGADPKWDKWISWQMPTTTNPHIDPAEVEEAKRDLPWTTFAQEFLAEFLDVAGRFFDEWEPTRSLSEWDDVLGELVETQMDWHVCDPFEIPSWWHCWGAVDFGTSKDHPTWCFLLFAIDEEGTVYIIDEIYEAGKLAAEQAQLILECLERHKLAYPTNHEQRDTCLWKISKRFLSMPMDYAGTFPPENEKDRLPGKYPVEYYWGRGLTMATRAVKDRVAGWQEMKSRMHGWRVIKDDETEEETAVPILMVFRGKCPNLIRTIPQMIRSDMRPEDIEGGWMDGGEKKQEDHPCDTARYGLCLKPPKSPPNPKIPKPKQWQLPHELTSDEDDE